MPCILTLALFAAEIPVTPATLAVGLRALRPSDSLILADGIYREGVIVPTAAWGREGEPTVIRAANIWGAIILSGPDGLAVTLGRGAHDIHLSGIRVHGALADGVWARDCSRVVIESCRIEHCARNGVTLFGDDSAIRGCVIRYNGLGSYSHGIYMHGQRNAIMMNVIACNSGYGLHGFHEDDPSALVECLIAGNLVYGHGLPAFSSDQNPGKAGLLIETGERNVVAGNMIIHNYVDMSIRSPGNIVMGNTTGRAPRLRPWRRDFPHWPATSRPAED